MKSISTVGVHIQVCMFYLPPGILAHNAPLIVELAFPFQLPYKDI
jgi:hypothetical protein